MADVKTSRAYFMGTDWRRSFRPFEIAQVVGACLVGVNACVEVEYPDGTRDYVPLFDPYGQTTLGNVQALVEQGGKW
jgi:hypothetical protein